jgi:hypothetical protein
MAAMPEPDAHGLQPQEQAVEASPEARTTGLADGAEASWPATDRRRTADRRHRPTRFWDTLVGPSRRRHGRRRGDHDRLYVDVYHPSDVALVLSVFVLNLLDAFFTLNILRKGGTEENPLMERLLQAGDASFLFEKCFLVGFWLVLLIVHKNFRLARIGLWLLLAAYSALFGWHVLLHYVHFGGI